MKYTYLSAMIAFDWVRLCSKSIAQRVRFLRAEIMGDSILVMSLEDNLNLAATVFEVSSVAMAIILEKSFRPRKTRKTRKATREEIIVWVNDKGCW